MPKGSLEYDPAYITPTKAASPEAYSAASAVEVSPIRDVQKEAEAQSMQEDYTKKLGNVPGPTKKRKIGGKKHRKTKKTKRRSTKRR